MTSDELHSLIASGLACDHLEVTGDGRHWAAVIVSPAFEGKRLIARSSITDKQAILSKRPLYVQGDQSKGAPGGVLRKGMVVTSTGIVFATAKGGKLYAFDGENGNIAQDALCFKWFLKEIPYTLSLITNCAFWVKLAVPAGKVSA